MFYHYNRGGSMAQWSELGIWMQKTRAQIPNLDYWMNLFSITPGENSPCFVNSQLVCLLPVGILNRGERGILTWHWKAPLGELSLHIYINLYYIILIKNVVIFLKFSNSHLTYKCYPHTFPPKNLLPLSHFPQIYLDQ